MPFPASALVILLTVRLCFCFTDVTCYNSVIGQNNSFRVFTPLTYNPADTAVRYPVLYFLHGCRGSHRYGDANVSTYAALGLSTPPVDSAHGTLADYNQPYNPDFENYTDTANIIIVACNGNFAAGGCAAWESLPGQSVNLGAMFRELIDTVDSRFNTIAGRSGRAITGISMGGYAASFIAGCLPDRFLSASQFCRAPGPYLFEINNVDGFAVDVNAFWRNFRDLPFRCSTNQWDYLKYFSLEMGRFLEGASPGTETQETNGRRHYAGDITRQLDFHVKYFNGAAIPASGMSHISFYPDFDFYGYSVHADFPPSGYLYLKDITHNGFGVYTRQVPPFGVPDSDADFTVTTAARLKPATDYTVARYHYGADTVSIESARSDGSGRLVIRVTAPLGQEIGICGDTLPPPVLMLLDTFCETIYLPSERDTVAGIEVINLSDRSVTARFTTSTENSDLLTLSDTVRTVTLAPRKRVRIDTLTALHANRIAFPGNTGFLKVRQAVDGVPQEREYLIPITVIGAPEPLDTGRYSIDDNPVSGNIGNGDGIPDSGEVVSIWVNPPAADTINDIYGFRPVLPGLNRPSDLSMVSVSMMQYDNRIHYLISLRVNRTFTIAQPCSLTVMARVQWDDQNKGGLDGTVLKNYAQVWHSLVFPKEAVAIENKRPEGPGELFSVSPNPFNPTVTITLPGPAAASIIIYDIRGNRVADLSDRVKNGKVVWSARNGRGNAAPAGIYFVRVKYGKAGLVKRLAYLP